MNLRIISKCLESPDQELSLPSISHFHWVEEGTDFEGIYTQEELCDFVKAQGDAYIIDYADPTGRKKLHISVGQLADGKKYAKTTVRGLETDHLLKLPDCGQ